MTSVPFILTDDDQVYSLSNPCNRWPMLVQKRTKRLARHTTHLATHHSLDIWTKDTNEERQTTCNRTTRFHKFNLALNSQPNKINPFSSRYIWASIQISFRIFYNPFQMMLQITIQRLEWLTPNGSYPQLAFTPKHPSLEVENGNVYFG